MSKRVVGFSISSRMESFTRLSTSVFQAIKKPVSVALLELPLSTWAWLKERRRGERRWEYILGLAAFALIIVGTTFSGLQWQLARVGNRLSEQSNAIAMIQLRFDTKNITFLEMLDERCPTFDFKCLEVLEREVLTWSRNASMVLEWPTQISSHNILDTFNFSKKTKLLEELWTIVCWRVLGITIGLVLIQELLQALGSGSTRPGYDVKHWMAADISSATQVDADF